MADFDTRVAGGEAVLPGLGRTAVDIYLRDGRIAALVSQETAPLGARETIDASGRVIVPGAIDAHVHLGQDLSAPRTEADAAAETASAAAGGVTTMLAYLMSPKPYEEIIGPATELMSAHAHTDFGFHFCLVTRDQIEAVPRYINEHGVSSFKFFMNFRGDEGAYLGLPGNDDGFLYDILTAVAENGAMACPHAENIELVWRIRERMEKKADAGLDLWDRARPDFVEAEAEQRVAYLAGVVGASVYAVHVSSARALSVLAAQRKNNPNIFIETCPHYLTLSNQSEVGVRGKVNPPLRSGEDRDSLWAAVADGTVDVVGSDHVPRHFSAKDKDLWSASAGFPGTGTLLPLLVSEGRKRGVLLERVVELTSTRPAQLFGLYPRKGVIRVGADADLAILNLGAQFTVAAAAQHSGAQYSVWEGCPVDCVVEHTLVRGRFAIRDGELRAPAGRFTPRRSSGRAALTHMEAHR